MITVNEDYVIIVDQYNYCVAKNKPIIDKKTGRVQYVYDSYFRDIESALEYIRKESIRDRLIGCDMTIGEAIKEIRSSNVELEKTITRILEDDMK